MSEVKPDRYQQEVIDCTSKDCVVLAGAGSGKTFTLISKINKLVEQHRITPDCILVLTFTRVAATNMREKYLSTCTLSRERIPDFNTFHAFCYKVLKEYPETLEDAREAYVSVSLDDQNGDGYSDLRAVFAGPGGEETVLNWLWDAESGAFVCQPDSKG